MMDFLSSHFRRDPFNAYRMARLATPVLRDPVHGLWILFDHESVKRALLEPAMLGSRVTPPGGTAPDWLVFTDPPRHAKLRAIVARAFTRRSIDDLEPRVRMLSGFLLDESAPRGEMDFVADYAAPLPVMVMAELMGVPLMDLERLFAWSEAISNLSYSLAGGEAASRAAEAYHAASQEMDEYVARLLAERLRQPANDLLTRLAHAEVDGERLTREEILGFFQLLLSAGTETSTNLIANTLLCLVEAPHERERIERDPGLVPRAIEEVMRFRSPVQMIFRQTRQDFAVRGQTIPRDNLVLAMIGSANRDDAVFAQPRRFDVGRDPNPHLGFGHGIHHCIGAMLARLEARVALEDSLRRLRDVALASRDPWEPRPALHIHGPRRLPVRFRVAEMARPRPTSCAGFAATPRSRP